MTIFVFLFQIQGFCCCFKCCSFCRTGLQLECFVPANSTVAEMGSAPGRSLLDTESKEHSPPWLSQRSPGPACPVLGGVSGCGGGKWWRTLICAAYSHMRTVELSIHFCCFFKSPSLLKSSLVVQWTGRVSEGLPCQSLHLRKTVLLPALTTESSLL